MDSKENWILKDIKNLRAFEIKYLPPTNLKGSRVLINDLRHKKRVIIAYDYDFNNCKYPAVKFLNDKKIKILYSVEIEKGFILLTDDFATQIKGDSIK